MAGTGAPLLAPVAVKRMGYPTSPVELTRVCREIGLMRRLEHPNLLTIRGVCATADALSLVTELLPRGSIYTWLHTECKGVPPPLAYSLRLLRDTASGLAHLHSRSPRVAHRDVKTLNLLLASDYSVRPRHARCADEQRLRCVQLLSSFGRDTPVLLLPEPRPLPPPCLSCGQACLPPSCAHAAWASVLLCESCVSRHLSPLACVCQVRVADFGLSREFMQTAPMSRVGTVQYAC